MACYHPKKAFILGINPETNNKILKIRPYEVKYLIKEKNSNKYLDCFDSYCKNALNCGEKLCTYDCPSFEPLFNPKEGSKVYYEFLTIPCGQCIGCRIAYSREWACRMMLENEYSTASYFITLTYDDEHITKKKKKIKPEGYLRSITQYPNMVDFVDCDTGEMLEHMTLNKKDMEYFIKRLRKQYGPGIRYYYCGEYGSKTMRPHYHSIFFNLPISDLVFFKKSPDGKFNYFLSPTIERLWPFGYHLITEVSFDTCAYVARYVTKKAKGLKREYYERLGILPEFSNSSRRPGIGRQWFEDHGAEAYKTYIITVSSPNGGLRLKPPRYYDNLYDVLDGVRMAEIKDTNRFKAESIARLKLDNTDLGYLDMLEVEEFNFQHNPKNKYGILERSADV